MHAGDDLLDLHGVQVHEEVVIFYCLVDQLLGPGDGGGEWWWLVVNSGGWWWLNVVIGSGSSEY